MIATAAPTTKILVGDCIEQMRTLPDSSVHCCVTSPPYWGLRDYGCDGQIGLESTPEQFVAKMVDVFREVRRVLREDGTCWVNLGDSYNANQGQGFDSNRDGGSRKKAAASPKLPRPDGIKPKDLVGIPWRVAFALQADGWYLRQDIIWAKPNPMPESVRDRCTKSHEYVFLLSKSARYFYDAEAVKESPTGNTHSRGKAGRGKDAAEINYKMASLGSGNRNNPDFQRYMGDLPAGTPRNRRSVWTVATAPYKEAHFATFPPKLIEPCIKAGTSERGCCEKCGAPLARVVERAPGETPGANGSTFTSGKSVHGKHNLGTGDRYVSKSAGWRPTCQCDAPTVPCVVLDPFGGSGATAGVANALGRDAILCELNPAYAELIPARIEQIRAKMSKPARAKKKRRAATIQQKTLFHTFPAE